MRSTGGYGLLDLPFLCDLFHYSTGLEPVGSVHFRAGAIERGAARAADAKMAEIGVNFSPSPSARKYSAILIRPIDQDLPRRGAIMNFPDQPDQSCYTAPCRGARQHPGGEE